MKLTCARGILAAVKSNGSPQRVELGQHIVADPKICHGKLTFKGTRIMVWQLFEHLALGEPLEEFPKHFPGRITIEAAREALEIGRQFFADSPNEIRRWAVARRAG